MYGSILATTFVIAGGGIMWIAKMAHDETLPPNYWAGIRTPRTLHSDEAWRVGHKAAAVWIFLAGVLTFAAGVSCIFLSDEMVTWVAFAVVALLVGPLLIGTFKAHKAIDQM